MNQKYETIFDEIAALPQNWDGENADPIHPRAIAAARQALRFYCRIMTKFGRTIPPIVITPGWFGEVDVRLMPRGPTCINVIFSETEMPVHEARAGFAPVRYPYNSLPVCKGSRNVSLLGLALCSAVLRQ